VGLVERWRQIERGLPEDWAEARLLLRISDPARTDRAAELLGPLNAGRAAEGLTFSCARRGAGLLPDLMVRLLRRLDDEGIDGELELVSSAKAEPPPAVAQRARLAEEWEVAVAALPPDWSDVYAELELTSSDYLDRAALLMAPLNPARHGDRPVFRFRCARRFGYGASPGMVRRCLERLDNEGITGEPRILHVQSDTHPAATQGPVWYVGGRSV
jgi:hypothetical protein